MGGLVARTMGELENAAGGPLYNGLITFGTPHLGAYAANTLVENQDLLNDILVNACEKLGKGPFLEGINNSSGIGGLAVLFGFGGGALNTVCEEGVDIVFPAALSFAMQGVEAELTTTAAQSIPPMPTDNKAVFFGIEAGHNDGSLTPRFIGAMLFGPNTFPLYGADASDQMGIELVNSQLDFYVTQMNHWQEIHDDFCEDAILGLCWTSAERIAEGYEDGVEWINTLDPTWQEIIGARQTILEQVGCKCDYYDYGDFVETVIYLGDSDCSSQNDEDTNCSRYFEGVVYQHNSDGFILAESAMNGPGMNYDVRFMDGSNHMQMKNDSEMQKAVNQIFLHGLGKDYFKTDER